MLGESHLAAAFVWIQNAGLWGRARLRAAARMGDTQAHARSEQCDGVHLRTAARATYAAESAPSASLHRHHAPAPAGGHAAAGVGGAMGAGALAVGQWVHILRHLAAYRPG